MKLPKSETYYLLLESYVKALAKGSIQSSHIERATITEYSREDDNSSFKIFQDVVVIEQGLLSALLSDEIKMIAKIAKELHMNNALWYYERNTSADYRTIKKLTERKILVHTEDSSIFIVNPMWIRRGTIPSVLAQTAFHLSSMSRVHKTMIHDLKYRKVDFNQFDVMGLPNAV